jgi:hypothetical protein
MSLVSRFLQNKKLLYVAVLGLAVRAALAPFTGHPFDISTWFLISNEIIHNQFVISAQLSVAPSFYYTLTITAYMYHYLAGGFNSSPILLSSLPAAIRSAADWTGPSRTIVVPNWQFLVILKTPFILSDLGCSLLVYRIVSKLYNQQLALFSFALIFLNPMLIWVSAVWGMFDSLPAFFVLLSTFLILNEKYSLAAVSLAVAIGFKVYPIFFVIPVALYIYKKTHSLRILAAPAASFSLSMLAIFSPFLRHLPAVMQAYLGTTATGSTSNTVVAYGLTYWSIAPLAHISADMAGNLSFLLFIALGILTTLLSAILMIRNTDFQTFLYSQVLTTSTIFFSYLTVNEQWFVWLLPPIVLLAASKWIRMRSVLILSVLALIYSWSNSLFAAFFLPTSLYDPNIVESIYFITSHLIPFRLVLMASIGLIFSAFLATIIFKIGNKIRKHIDIGSSEGATTKNCVF